MSATAVRPADRLAERRDTVRAVILAYELGFDAGFYDDQQGPAPYGFGTLEAIAWAEGWIRGANEAIQELEEVGGHPACDGTLADEEEGEL